VKYRLKVVAWVVLRILTFPIRAVVASHRADVARREAWKRDLYKSVTVTYTDGTTEEFNGAFAWHHDKQFQTVCTREETFKIPVERVHEVAVRRAY
jgi:hypothetical protein